MAEDSESSIALSTLIITFDETAALLGYTCLQEEQKKALYVLDTCSNMLVA